MNATILCYAALGALTGTGLAQLAVNLGMLIGTLL
jgi:hypothetical protein